MLLPLLVAAVSCKGEFHSEAPTFSVNIPASVKAGQTVSFEFSGYADIITFKSGEDTSSVVTLKSFSDPLPSGFSYRYESPGVYNAEFYAVNASYENREEKIVTAQVSVLLDTVSITLPEGLDCFEKGAGMVGIIRAEGETADYPYYLSRQDGGEWTLYPSDKTKVFGSESGEYISYYPYSFDGGNSFENVRVSLPEVQTQKLDGDCTHLADIYAMRATPVSTGGGNDMLSFSYTGLFSVLCLELGLSDAVSVSVPVKKVSLNCPGSVLSIKDGNYNPADLSSQVNIVQGSDRIDLLFLERPVIVTGGTVKLYFLVNPGRYEELSVSVVAANNYIASASICEVALAVGGLTTAQLTVSGADFKDENPFGITPDALSVSAGTPIEFRFSGDADIIRFWSGEKYHNWEYSSVPSPYYPEYYMSFGTRNFVVTGQTAMISPVSVLVSTDFSGNAKADEIKSATWTDVSSYFVFDDDYTRNTISRQDDSQYTPSGEACIDSWFGPDNVVYVCFKYETDAGKRTLVYLKNFVVAKSEGDEKVIVYSMNKANLYTVNGYYTASGFIWYESSAADEDKNVLRLASNGAANPETAYGYAFAKISRDSSYDTPSLLIKQETDAMPESFSYTYGIPGEYHAVFEVSVPTLTGSETVLFEYTISII